MTKHYSSKSSLRILCAAFVAVSLSVSGASAESTQPYAAHPSLAQKHSLAAKTRSAAKVEAEKLAKAKSETSEKVMVSESEKSDETARARLRSTESKEASD